MSTPDPQNKPAPTSAPTPAPAPAPKPAMPAAAPAPVKKQRSVIGCLGRLLAALLVVLITTIVALAAVAGGASWLGFTPQSANELRAAQLQVATLEARNSALEGQNVAVQTQIAKMIGQAGADRETLDELRSEVEQFAKLSDKVESSLTQSSREQATVLAEMRTSREAVATFATAEAGRAQVLSELQRRSERVERFLQRLSDISGDAALDVQSPTPTVVTTTTVTLQATATAQPSAAPQTTPTAQPSAVPQTTPTAQPSSTALTQTPTSMMTHTTTATAAASVTVVSTSTTATAQKPTSGTPTQLPTATKRP